MRHVGQGDGEGHAGVVFRDAVGADGGPGDVAVIHHVGGGGGACDRQVFIVAVGRRADAVDRAGDGCDALQVVVIGAAVNRHVGVQGAGGNGHGLVNAANGDVERQVGLRRMVNAEAEGQLVAFDYIAGHGIALCIEVRDADLGCRGVDRVMDNRDNVGVIDRQRGKAAALHRADTGLQCFAVAVDVVALHRRQHRAGGRTRRDDDDGTIAQGDGHVRRGWRTQRGGVGHARAAFEHRRIAGELQCGRGRDFRYGLQVRGKGRCGEVVVVSEGLDAFGDAQQLHKGAAAVRTAARTHAGRRGVQGLVQVGAAFECLDDGVGGGRGGDRAILGRGAMVGLDHVFIEAHGL